MIYSTHKPLKEKLQADGTGKSTIGMVPTMGALHDGHLALIKNAATLCDRVIITIYVNPTQFENSDDLKAYPKSVETDIQKVKRMLSQEFPAMPDDSIYFYIPDNTDIYTGAPQARKYDFDGLDTVMEGAHRPGHFNGVGTILEFLFTTFKPDIAFFGEKDYQQLQIVRKLVANLELPIRIIGCDIVREGDGLARSSRNQRLSHGGRKKALILYQQLLYARKAHAAGKSFDQIREGVKSAFAKADSVQLHYFTIADPQTLREPQNHANGQSLRAFIAATVENVRLIDNLALES